MKRIYEILTAATVLVGFIAIGTGVWLWVKEGLPLNSLIANRNTLGNNPVHISYIGIVISGVSAFHGGMKYGWFHSNK